MSHVTSLSLHFIPEDMGIRKAYYEDEIGNVCEVPSTVPDTC